MVDQLNSVKSAGGKPQVASQWQEAVYGLTAGYRVQVTPTGKRNHAIGEQFQVSGELALWFAQAPGEALDFAQVRRIEGKDAVCLPQLGLFDDDGFRLISSRFGHNLFIKLQRKGSKRTSFQKDVSFFQEASSIMRDGFIKLSSFPCYHT